MYPVVDGKIGYLRDILEKKVKKDLLT